MSGPEASDEPEVPAGNEPAEGPPNEVIDHIHLFEIFDQQHDVQPGVGVDGAAAPETESSSSDDELGVSASWRDVPKILFKRGVQKAIYVAAVYPIRFAKTLVQLGYIPKELASHTTIGGVQMYGIPSIFEYMKYIRTAEGVTGLVRGELSYGCSVVLYCLINDYTKYRLTKNRDPARKRSLYYVCYDIWWTTATSSAVAVLLTHPLAVLSLRQMSQFVGKENIYSDVYGLKNLLLQPGIFALLDGIIPRYVYLMVPTVAGKIAVAAYEHCFMTHTQWHHPYSSSDMFSSVFYGRLEWVKKLVGRAAANYVSDILYPMDVVFVVSSVARSGVVPGEYPFAPNAASWISRLVYMAKHHQLWRRTSFLSRVFTEYTDAFIVY